MTKITASKPKKISEDPEGPWIKHTTPSNYKIFVNESYRQSLNPKKELSTRSFGKIIALNKTERSNLISPIITLSGKDLVNIPNQLLFLAFHPKEGFVQNYNFQLSKPPISFQSNFYIDNQESVDPYKLLIPGRTVTLSHDTIISINRPILYLTYASPELEGDIIDFNATKGEVSDSNGTNDKNEEITIKIVKFRQLKMGDKIEIKQKSKLKLLIGDLFFGETRVSYVCESPLSDIQLNSMNCLTEVSEEIVIDRKSDNLKKWRIQSRIKNESNFPININSVKIYSDRKLLHEKSFSTKIDLGTNKEWSYNSVISVDDETIPELSHSINYNVPPEINGKYEGFFNFLGYNIDIKTK